MIISFSMDESSLAKVVSAVIQYLRSVNYVGRKKKLENIVY
jgi:hypothetical protein